MRVEGRFLSENRDLEMEVEMSLRAIEDIEIGEDIAPQLPPLSYSLHDAFLHSHCSSCFSPLPDPPLLPANSLHYCSPRCSSSSLPVSTAEVHLLRTFPSPSASTDTSDLRAALRLLQSLPAVSRPLHAGRIAGLLTNRDRLLSTTGDDELHDRLEGAREMATTMKMRGRDEGDGWEPDDILLEAALCLVITNAVEVQDDTGRALGIAVYGPSFSWINHSCSPNACYRFSPSCPPACCAEASLRMAPCAGLAREAQIENGVCSVSELKKDEVFENNGPRIVVRSINRIKKGEEVTIAYTDLLQPKALRQSELWSKYRFICCCMRCNASPLTYVDHTLQEISAATPDSSLYSDHNYYGDNTIRSLTDLVDDAINEYLSVGDPESCCKKLEDMLTHGLPYRQIEGCKVIFKLHPLHFLSLNAYTTLASAYKVRANDLVMLYSETNGHPWEALEFGRTSAAYSLVLAGATHHLFHSESSLIASAANYWVSAGESLLTLARSSVWCEFVEGVSLSKYMCSKCSLMEKLKAILCHRQTQNADFEYISTEFLDCVANITQKVWRFLVRGCQYLSGFNDPVDFRWLQTMTYSVIRSGQPQLRSTAVGSYHGTEESVSVSESRIYIFQLGVHCLFYGGYLASICYGRHSHLTTHIQNILDWKSVL